MHILYGENNLTSNDTAVPVVETATMRLYVREKIPTGRQLCQNIPNSILDRIRFNRGVFTNRELSVINAFLRLMMCG